MSAPTTRAERLVLIKQFDLGPLAQGLRLLPLTMDSRNARAQLLKQGLQESRLYWRDQVDAPGKQILGPALGWLQMERGCVRGLMRHPATKQHLRNVCRARNVPYEAQEIWIRFKTDDVFAAAVGRLNLWWHSKPIPAWNGDCWDSWAYYIDCWQPGQPHPETWPGFHEEVVAYLATKP